MTDDTAARMTEATAAWLDAFTPEQRAKASFPFGDEAERTSWAYFPRNHSGLPLLEQDVRQQKLAHVLFACSLSLPAYAKVNTIIGLESVLNEIEQRRADTVRDPGRYFVSVFGAPGDASWGGDWKATTSRSTSRSLTVRSSPPRRSSSARTRRKSATATRS